MPQLGDAVQQFDAVVVGGGPSGLFAAHALAANGSRTVLLEAGKSMLGSLCPKIRTTLEGKIIKNTARSMLQCPRCTCLQGIGGAAFHFDTNLGTPYALNRPKIEKKSDGVVTGSNTLASALASEETAKKTINAVFDTFYGFGLPVEQSRSLSKAKATDRLDGHFVATDLSRSQSITVDQALSVVENIIASMHAHGGETRFETRVTDVGKGTWSRFRITMIDENGDQAMIEASHVILAVGKLGLSWVGRLIDKLDIETEASTTIDVGVRLEGLSSRMRPLSEQCSNPKLSFINARDETVRTFCLCAGGRIMQYAFENSVVLDGQHCISDPTERTNLGIITAYKVPPGHDGTALALDIAEKVTTAGQGNPVACTVAELRAGFQGETPHFDTPLKTSLIRHTHTSLMGALPDSVVGDVLDMIDRLNSVYPGMVHDDDVIAAPVIERIYPRLKLSPGMESSQSGLFFVGDSSSKIIGVTYGAATGLAAAQTILDRLAVVPC